MTSPITGIHIFAWVDEANEITYLAQGHKHIDANGAPTHDHNLPFMSSALVYIMFLIVIVCISFLQAVDSDLVPYLLKLLGDGLTGLENPAATKAQIVKSLKAMQTCLQHGEKVSTQPNSYSISHYAALLLHCDWRVTV